MPEPPGDRPASQPWPTYPMIFRVSSAHEEAGDRVYAVSTQEFLGDESGRVRSLRLVDVVFEGGRPVEVAGTEREIPADLVLLAMGFTGPQTAGLVEQLGCELDERGNVAPRRDVRLLGRRCLRGRRLRSRPVADRVGDRRGAGRRGRRGRLPDRLHGAAVARSRRPRVHWPCDAVPGPRTDRSWNVPTFARLKSCEEPRSSAPSARPSDAGEDPRAGRRRDGRRPAEHEPRQLRGPRAQLPPGAAGLRRERPRRRHLRRPPGPEDPPRDGSPTARSS